MQELNSESYNQKILLKKSAKMDLIFDQLPYPHKAVRDPTDHRHIGMTTYSRVQKNWNEVFFKILKKPSIVQKKMIPHIKGLDFSQR